MTMVTPTLVPMVPTAVELAAARAWLTDRQWVDADGELIAELSARTVFRAVDAHHDGGWAQFTLDMATEGTEDQMTWTVTCRNQIVTDHALAALGHHDLAETLRERGERSLVCARAVFDDEAVAVAYADQMASTFPEDEVGLWSLVQRAEATSWPGRRRDSIPFVADSA